MNVRIWLAASLTASLCAATVITIRAGQPGTAAAATAAVTVSGPMLFRGVSLSRDAVFFSLAGDLWRVSRTGGEAIRLTHDGAEDDAPVVSPDGATLAFGRNAGDLDVYVMPSDGGSATRLTYFPKADMPVGWTPDGRHVLFTSGRDGDGVQRLYTIPAGGVLETPIPLPWASYGSFASEGRRIAYTPRGLPAGIEWDRYRGGLASPVWTADLDTLAITRLTDGRANARYPQWVGNAIYFVSDETGVFNLYRYETGAKRAHQLTTFDAPGIESMSASAAGVVFVRDGAIYLYDPERGAQQPVPVTVRFDTTERTARVVDASRWMQSAALAATGDRVAIGARGDVFVATTAAAGVTAIIETPGTAERYPVLSPDATRLAYFSDSSGEYELYVRTLADGQTRPVGPGAGRGFGRELSWSPDSRHLLFSDLKLRLWIADAETGETRLIDQGTYVAQDAYNASWAPGGTYVAYAKALGNRNRAAFIYDVKARRSHQVTTGATHVESPVFDRSGRYLYFISSNNARLAAASDTGWGLLSTVLSEPLVTRTLYVATLSAQEPAPVLPMIGRAAPGLTFASADVAAIDLAGLESRVVSLPAGTRDYRGLAASGPGRVYVRVAEWPSTPGILGASPAVALYELALTEPGALKKIADNVDRIEASADGATALYRSRGAWFVRKDGSDPARLDTSTMKARVDPEQEWRQMYHEAWRHMRDTFYDPGHHGVDLPALERHYERYLPGIQRRRDLNLLFRMMLARVSVGHLVVGGGDAPAAVSAPPVGDIGATFDVHDGRYRFTSILRTPHFSGSNPFSKAPLDQPGHNVRVGEYLVSIDGTPITPDKNVFSYFAGKVNQPVQLGIAPSQGGAVRDITVVPIAGTGLLQNQNWGEANRRRVEQATGGRVAYIYVPSYGGGLDEAIRGVLAATDREGLIIDQRRNGGGVTPDSLIEMLQRRELYRYAYRYGGDFPTPPVTVPGPRLLLVDEHNFSAAETFALMFKRARLGTIVGTTTGGGGVGVALFQPGLTDGGFIDIPNRAAFDSDGWAIENVGVTPDVAVELSPRDWRDGRDPQLEQAIRLALAALESGASPTTRRPPYRRR